MTTETIQKQPFVMKSLWLDRKKVKFVFDVVSAIFFYLRGQLRRVKQMNPV